MLSDSVLDRIVFDKIRTTSRIALSKAIKDKKVIKNTFCEICGNESKTEAHHYDYDKPIDVIWVCSRCHGCIHRASRKEHKKMVERIAKKRYGWKKRSDNVFNKYVNSYIGLQGKVKALKKFRSLRVAP